MDLTDKDGKFLRAGVTIRSISEGSVRLEDGSTATKLIVHFEDKQKGMVLNKTNNRALIKRFGWDTNNWIGKKLSLLPKTIPAFGKMVDTIQIIDEKPAPKKGKEDVAPSEIPESVGKREKTGT